MQSIAAHLATVIVLLAVSPRQMPPNASRTFPLFTIDKTCVCIATKSATATVMSSERRVRDAQYQVFRSRRSGAELFRVRVGTYVSSEPEKWWNYGIADERDFNGDGVPDYSWYGGDDTGFEMYLFLSRDGRFERVNILKTVATAWQQRHRKSPPDFGDSGGEYCVDETTLVIKNRTPHLVVTVRRVKYDGTDLGTEHFDIPQPDFKP